MNFDWQHEGDRMRLHIEGRPTHTLIMLDGDRWKVEAGTEAVWYSSLKDARHAGERSARSRLPLNILTTL